MKIIDFHAHIYPPKISEKASLSTGDFYNIKPAHSGTGKELLSVGKSAGISEFVLLPVATKPEQVHHINNFILDEVTVHSEFHGFGTLHPDSENMLAETEFIIKSGLQGIRDCLKYSITFREKFPCSFIAVTKDLIIHTHADSKILSIISLVCR